jgi:hypothetical protein
MTCLINSVKHNSEQNRNVTLNKVTAELLYYDNSLFLRIENNSNDSVYLYTDIIDKVEVYHDRKRVNADFLYSFDDLNPFPDPPKYDSLDHTDHRIAAYINLSNPEEADSLLLNYFLEEFLRLNKVKKIGLEERSILSSKFEVVMFLTGGILFLPPHDSYTFEKKYACFKRNPGNYKIKCQESRKNKHEYYMAEGLTKNTIIKLPYKPPLKFMGFTRYDNRLKCKSIRFITK